MRSVSGSWNRIILASAGIVTVIAASWVLASGLNVREHWPATTSFLAPASTRIDNATMGQEAWLLPAVFAASIIAVLLGVVLLIMQVPRKASASPLRFTDADGTLLATISPEVLAQALSERGEDVLPIFRCQTMFRVGDRIPRQPAGASHRNRIPELRGRMGGVRTEKPTRQRPCRIAGRAPQTSGCAAHTR